jgi:hypothetical protein
MTSTDQNQLIADLARDIVAQIAPQELPLFRATSAAYFKNPEKALKKQTGKDEMLGFGAGEMVPLLTPVVLAVITEVVTFLTVEVKKAVAAESASLISEQVKNLFKKFHPEGEIGQRDPAQLTHEQLARVHKLAYERFLQLKLPETQADRLADAITACLITDLPNRRKR